MEQVNADGARLVGEQQERLFYDVLQEVSAVHLPEGIYTAGAPYALRGRGSDGENGDRHFYGVGHRRMPVSRYNEERAHFFSEYGMQSFPEYATVMRFAPDTATHHTANELMMSHQRGGRDANKVMEWYLENEYGTPRDFRQFLYASQVLQGDAMRTAIEAHRRDKPHCLGSLLWQHDDCWPVASWSTHDYYGRWKAAHYMVRRAFEAVIASAVTDDDSLRVYVVSDLLSQQQGTLELSVYTLDGEMVCHRDRAVTIPANTAAIVARLPLDDLPGGHPREEVFIHIGIATRQGFRHEGNYFLCRQKDLRWSAVAPQFQVEGIDGGCRITVRSDKLVRALCLSIDDGNTWLDDNYMDILPNVPTQYIVHTPLTTEEVRRRLTFHCINQMRTMASEP